MFKTARQYKIDVLKWFLDFINLEIGDLSHGERLMCITDALYIIESGLSDTIYIHIPESIRETISKRTHEWEAEGTLVECHTFLKEFFENLMENIQKNTDLGKKWVPEQEITHLKALASFETDTRTAFRLSQDGPFESKVINKGKKGEQKLYRLKQDELYSFGFRIVVLDKRSDEKQLLYAFFSALSNVQVGSLRVCAECGNYFLHTSRKEKKFCNPRCAARKVSRDRRERIKKDDKKYAEELKKGADRARKSYKKKTPRGKPARRPYKHKDSTEK